MDEECDLAGRSGSRANAYAENASHHTPESAEPMPSAHQLDTPPRVNPVMRMKEKMRHVVPPMYPHI